VNAPRTIIERQRRLAEIERAAKTAAQRAHRAPSIPDASDEWRDEITKRTSPAELAKLTGSGFVFERTPDGSVRLRASGVAGVVAALALVAAVGAWYLSR
jgi:hypothetical protein